MNKHKSHHGESLNLSWKSSLEVQSKIFIGAGSLNKLPNVLSQIHSGHKVLLLKPAAEWTDENKRSGSSKHTDGAGAGDNVIESAKADLERHGNSVHLLELPDGEECKSIEWLTRIWDILHQLEFTRQDTVVAIGGGSITDVAGFAAATYLRGIDLVTVPTSLLAQVDAAIGGKTGVNFHKGKNLVGAFYFAQAVIVDTNLLATLPKRQFVSGMAEIIKCSFIEKTVAAETEYQVGPRNLFDVLTETISDLAWDNPALAHIIAACIKMKLCVAAKDPLESGLRRCLNLGHTLGHALESVTNFSLSHGEAVAIGMAFALHMAVSKDKLSKEDKAKALSLLKSAGLPITIEGGLSERTSATGKIPDKLLVSILLDALFKDKKREGQAIKMVLPNGSLGNVDYMQAIGRSEIEKHLAGFLSLCPTA